MSAFFISDLHLDPADPVRLQLFHDFLDKQASSMTSLYILGDLFNLWLGDDLMPDIFLPLIQQLRHLRESGTAVYLMVGNRDFLLGQQFARLAGCELLDDYHRIEINGVPALLMHGDTLCIDDVSYQRYRRWTRNPALQWCFLHLAVAFRQRIADRIKQQSRQAKSKKNTMIMDVNHDEVSRIIRKYGVSLLIHGHTHRPAIHQVVLDGRTAHRIVLGDWLQTPSYLRCDMQGHYQLVDSRVQAGELMMPCYPAASSTV